MNQLKLEIENYKSKIGALGEGSRLMVSRSILRIILINLLFLLT